VRASGKEPEVLMGERSSGHVFYPHHYVFPGGRVDRSDTYVRPATELKPHVLERLVRSATPRRAQALALAAVRETFEEAGPLVGRPHGGVVPKRVPLGWEGFFGTGMAPALDGLSYVYRAVTPPGRPRRFNARFFVTEAERVHGDMDEGSGELLKLRWFSIPEALALKIRPITAAVLREILTRVESGALHDPERPVPWVKTINGRREVGYD
jgi:8-oxo-dGTP pyrophosphatase MutT (NUDIX family)